jgi:16S rRNA G966 N2-methylase RsmD
MYLTKHSSEAINTRTKNTADVTKTLNKNGKINYVVWNDVYRCPSCRSEICFGETPDKKKPGEFNENFNCPHCNSTINEKLANKVQIRKFDGVLNDTIETVKDKPILVSYSVGKQNFWKKPDENDFRILKDIENLEIPYWVPNAKMPDGRSTSQSLKSHNISHVHQFYTKRNLYVISKFLDECKNKNFKIWFLISSLLQKASKLMALNKDYIGRVTKGVLYVSSTRQEINLFHFLKKNITSFKQALQVMNFNKTFIISTQSATDLSNIPSNSVDYIFIDPPFGGNIMYSELNFIWEAFLGVFTNNEYEAIENKVQGKDLNIYTSLMTKCFMEMFRILKPNRWITIEFHNSKASVWNSIHRAVKSAGFTIAQVSVLDKKVGSFKQVTTANSVKNDLIISAYKPKAKKSFHDSEIVSEDIEIKFLKDLLRTLPIQPDINRTNKMLFSKMIAHYIENGFTIKYDSIHFYSFLDKNFIELDQYWFLEDQVDEYINWKNNTLQV